MNVKNMWPTEILQTNQIQITSKSVPQICVVYCDKVMCDQIFRSWVWLLNSCGKNRHDDAISGERFFMNDKLICLLQFLPNYGTRAFCDWYINEYVILNEVEWNKFT